MKGITHLLCLIIVLFFQLCMFSCGSKTAPIEESTLQVLFSKELESIRNQYDLPGITAAYALKEEVNGFAEVGMADIEHNVVMNENSRMLAASIGKTFLSATVLDLVSEGKLTLDSPISRWIGHKEWFGRLPVHEELTLRNLLNHSSGIPDHVHLEAFGIDLVTRKFSLVSPPNAEQLISYIFDMQPIFPAETSWGYSDTGYLLIALVIEEVTNKFFHEAVRERLLIPLNLNLTSPSNTLDISDLATGYLDKDNAFGLPPRTTDASGKMLWNPGIESAGGGFVSSARDLAKWGKLLFEEKALKGKYLNELLEGVEVATISDDLKIYYGLGVGIYDSTPFGKVYGHGGWIPGYCSSLRYYPKFGLSIAFQINTDIGIQDRQDDRDLMNEIEVRLVNFILENGKLI